MSNTNKRKKKKKQNLGAKIFAIIMLILAVGSILSTIAIYAF